MIGRPLRPGFHTVAPYLIARDGAGLVAFVKRAFGAEETLRTRGAAGGTHVEVRIGDSMVMLSGGASDQPAPAILHLYVEDCDAVFRQALAAGATAVQEPSEAGDGDRRAAVADPFGNHWYVATHLGPPPAPEPAPAQAVPYLTVADGAGAIAFYERAFGAAETLRIPDDQGRVSHAELDIAGARVFVSDEYPEHGALSPQTVGGSPAMVVLLVPDADALFERAVAAGASVDRPMAGEPGAVRNGKLRDPYGHRWMIFSERGAG